jgi:hypothetical protein
VRRALAGSGLQAVNADTPEEIPQFQATADELGRRRDVEAIVGVGILPFTGRYAVVGEIGCGGGRVTPLAGGATVPAGLAGELDFIYALDLTYHRAPGRPAPAA